MRRAESFLSTFVESQSIHDECEISPRIASTPMTQEGGTGKLAAIAGQALVAVTFFGLGIVVSCLAHSSSIVDTYPRLTH